ncbi:MAG: sugar transferase [Armatimonadota bacterium]|nr:sugar transferase [Armatimonadota bacterium]MDR7450405.1 sugar transferase [Armatimonadota bacterium]MDR7467012.1 sugar transferase [Armatimonadota bacterium]MDR7493446.1 sugar transferase [Armatimonadota bacterium]MDR7498711.1 sugar transferase [Armatimonadota bacterium]
MLTESRRRQLRVLLAVVLDAGMIVAAFSLAYLLRFRWEIIPALDEPPAAPYFVVLTPLLPTWLLIFAAYGLYREQIQPFFDEALKVASAVAMGMMVLLAGSFFYRDFSYSRLWMLLAWALSTGLMLGARGTLRVGLRALRARGIDVRRVLIVGAGPEGVALARALRERPELGQQPVAFLDDRARSEVAGLPVAGSPGEVLRAVRRFGAHRVVIARPQEAREETMRVAALCQEAGVPFAIVPDLYTLAATGAAVEVVGRLPLLSLQGSPLGGWGKHLKDALDVVGALIGLVLTLPVFVLCALAVVVDSPGPVFYRQRRIGKGGVPFTAWKFRTMIRDAEAVLAQDERLRRQFERSFKLVDDPRVTRVGRFLRRTGLDELPQLLNVLRGEMSLVGPRPIVEEELAKYGPWERRLLCVKPGLTGLWQVLRHDEPDYAQRVRLDMYYIDHWSLGLDLQILFRTVPSVIAGRGAY